MHLGAIAMHRRDAAIELAQAVGRYWPAIRLDEYVHYDVAGRQQIDALVKKFNAVEDAFVKASRTEEVAL